MRLEIIQLLKINPGILEVIALDAQQNNRFIKILLLCQNTYDPILLYGFSTSTEQPIKPWHICPFDKAPWNTATAILSRDDASNILAALERGERTPLNSEIHLFSKLVERPAVLYNNNGNRSQDGDPLMSFHLLVEYWNTEKETLLQGIKTILNVDGKQLYTKMQEMLAWANKECGIDFSKQGHRFGNFERFDAPLYQNDFSILTHKESGLLQTTITKHRTIENNVIVRCASKHRARWILDEVKVMTSNQETVCFEAKEPMSHVFVQIWDVDTGKLLFSKDVTLMMHITYRMNSNTGAHRINDPWTESLHHSASNRGDKIK